MTKYAENLENTVRELIKSLLGTHGVSLRAAAKLTGIPHNTLGEKLNRGRALNLMDLALICEALKIRVSHLVAAAEWALSGQPPVFEDDSDVDWRQIHTLALMVNPELPFPPNLEPAPTPNTTPSSRLAPHENKSEQVFDTPETTAAELSRKKTRRRRGSRSKRRAPHKPTPTQETPATPTPLFSHRRDDGYQGDLALPRMA